MKKRTPHSSAGRCPVSHREGFTLRRNASGFTLMEILLVIAILAVLATIAALVLDPAEHFAQSRDSNRVNELKTLDNAVELALFSDSGVDGTQDDIVYLSLPDTNGNPNDDCQGEYPTLPDLSSGWEYRCNADAASLRNIDGTGWLPFDFAALTEIQVPLATLPVDPENSESRYYAYSKGAEFGEYSIFTPIESEKFASLMIEDGGASDDYYETAPIIFGSGAGISLALSVLVSDPDGDPMDVTFYDAAGGTVIGTAASIPSGSSAATTWASLERGTPYTWYATACDPGGCTTSPTWQFTTAN